MKRVWTLPCSSPSAAPPSRRPRPSRATPARPPCSCWSSWSSRRCTHP
ncbi:hypothetical protein ACFQVA_35310 [Actinomadura keratinilytica]